MKIPAQSQQSGWGLPLPETFMLGSLPSPVLLPFAPWPIFPENVSLVNHMNPTRLPGFASRAPDTGPRASGCPSCARAGAPPVPEGGPWSAPASPCPCPCPRFLGSTQDSSLLLPHLVSCFSSSSCYRSLLSTHPLLSNLTQVLRIPRFPRPDSTYTPSVCIS